ncbi:biotin--[acetyl-CoA-carboxylase] ligase [Chloroflexota bacterium]
MENNISSESITSDLGTSFIGQRVIYYPSLTSTMEMAKREGIAGAAGGTVIIADEQTAGRGRIKRAWLSPKGSISLSVILYPKAVCLPFFIMLASLAVFRTIEKVTGLKPEIKWPNDVLIGSKKVCGILIESDVRKDKVNYAVIGIGLNVNLRLADFPDISLIATSLSDELGEEVSRLEILRCLLVELEKLYLALPLSEHIFEEWRDRLVTLGKSIQVKSGNITHRGVAESVNQDGSLLLRKPDASLITIIAGDIATLRE